jgi:hypothetical protein
MTAPDILLVPSALLLGWLPSSVRLLKAWQANPGSAALFLLALVGLIAGTHAFFRWLIGNLKNQPEKSEGLPSSWRWKWTLCGYAVFFCAFLAIVSLILTVHQTYWISKSVDPWFVESVRSRIGIYSVAASLNREADRLKWEISKTRESFLRLRTGGPANQDQPAWEQVRPLWVQKDESTLRAIVLIPTRPLLRAKAKFAVIQPGTNVISKELNELPQTLAAFGLARPAENTEKRPALLP